MYVSQFSSEQLVKQDWFSVVLLAETQATLLAYLIVLHKLICNLHSTTSVYI